MKKLTYTTILCSVLALGAAATVGAQHAPVRKDFKHESRIASKPAERWWGGMVGMASDMPFASGMRLLDLSWENANNQNVPLLISSAGRYVWSDDPFAFAMRGDTLIVLSDYSAVAAVEAGATLRDACLAASKAYFPPTGSIPEERFFSQPQYNTWIELQYDQNQRDILDYARRAAENGFPAGIFMVDDNWQRYYGNFDFKAERFPDPRAMNDELHGMGFRTMLWVCPFYSPDTPEFRDMQRRGFLLRDRDGDPAIVRWWNGYSACLDVTNPDAVEYFKGVLRHTMERYGVDGYKFDAGDVAYMRGDYTFHDPAANVNVFSQRWAEIGLDFPYNELRTTWKTGGQPLVQRLGDKPCTWQANAQLIPHMTTAGMLGFPYTCPDMIGGGQMGYYAGLDLSRIDQELIVRSCQIHTLMPMMQFSVAPWRVLSPENREICARMARLHERMGPVILDLARHSAATGEPIVRSMEYQFPGEGLIECADQFMLGDKLLVAPMVVRGTERTVALPRGRWRDETGRVYRGGRTVTIAVPLDRLPYFEKIG